MKRISANITGRVQGVSFRYYTRRKANSVGLTGWVKNQPNGSVQVVAEGAEESLGELLQFLEHGPPSARVDNVTVNWSSAADEFSSFKIRF